ncbi:DsbA family protein [Rhizobium sp. BK068]|uniref:DsbA family oxidoreductase n=1 Tax=unclassified Rhizobium TaxID=2613769 RepID=UPI0032AEB70F
MLQIDLYIEITCPWCIIGQHRLDKVLSERFTGLAADIRHHPVLMMPDARRTGFTFRTCFSPATASPIRRPRSRGPRPRPAPPGWSSISAGSSGPIRHTRPMR